MLYENLVMQNVVASVEVTDDIPRRFITFAANWSDVRTTFPSSLTSASARSRPARANSPSAIRRVRGTDRH